MRVVRYDSGRKGEWDAFVQGSRNGTFLFFRDYMDYHSDRLVDFSLILEKDNQIVALFPANLNRETLESHGGLTYGGFIFGRGMSAPTMLEMMTELRHLCRAEGMQSVIYKTIPYIYWRYPSDEDRYALFLNEAELYRRDLMSVVDRSCPLLPQGRRARGARKAERIGLTVRESDDIAAFWRMLTENLLTKHQVAPTHSLDEIVRLQSRFPARIKLYHVDDHGAPVAGTVLYLTDTVIHAQYIAANEVGREAGALDLLFSNLLKMGSFPQQYFNFGTSTEEGGRNLNAGLVAFKEGFGARSICHDFYRVPA